MLLQHLKGPIDHIMINLKSAWLSRVPILDAIDATNAQSRRGFSRFTTVSASNLNLTVLESHPHIGNLIFTNKVALPSPLALLSRSARLLSRS